MRYASYLYCLLYPYLMLLSQYPIHTAYKNMMQTYDLTEYYLVLSTVSPLTGISVLLLYHCYQAIQPRTRYGIELANLILFGSYVYSFFNGNQLLPVFPILLVSDFARGLTMVYAGSTLCDTIKGTISEIHPVPQYYHTVSTEDTFLNLQVFCPVFSCNRHEGCYTFPFSTLSYIMNVRR